MRSCLLAIVFVSLLASPATALTPLTQERVVRAYSTHFNFFFPPEQEFLEEKSAPDFLPFDESVSNFPPVNTFATQNSTIGSSSISLSGSLIAHANASSIYEVERSYPESRLSVSFSLSEATRYSLLGEMVFTHDQCDGSRSGYVRLSGPGGIINDATYSYAACPTNPCVETVPANFYGELPPGVYDLDFEVTAFQLSDIHPDDTCDGSTDVSYDLELLLPRPTHLPGLSPGLLWALAASLLGGGTLALRSRRRQ